MDEPSVIRTKYPYCKNFAPFMSSLERLVCKRLSWWTIVHKHQPEVFPVQLDDGTPITYRPDFRVGKVYLEPHGDVRNDSRFLNKMRAFRKGYPDKYVVLISDELELLYVPPGIFSAKISSQEIGKLKSLLRRAACCPFGSQRF